ncbi:MAG: hypothetical protein GY950_18905, partial [bacterium]|nr:hypothetical protein [bacterium]
MIKKLSVVFMVVFFAAVLRAGTKVIPLPELMKPEHPLYFDKTQMYVIEGTSIYIYSLTDFKLVKKFGKQGEGPKEFILDPRFTGLFISVRTEDIVVESL